MSKTVTLAGAQLGPIHLADTRAQVVERLIALLETAAKRGADWVVFPELALTTFFPRYWMEDQDQVDSYFEAEMPGPETEPLFRRARELGVGFHIGYAELTKQDGHIRRYNTALIVGPEGRPVGKYRKIHLPGHVDHLPKAPFQHLEKRYFEVGDLGFPVWQTDRARIGTMICNDRRWPEAFRVMGLQGVDIVMIGYNTPSHNIHYAEPVHLRMMHNLLSVQAGAYQNACWVVSVAKAGYEDGHGLIGGSCIIAPTGEVAAQAISEDDELIMADADIALCEHNRRTVFDFARHRRPEHYSLILERTGAGDPLGS